jgi:hypothetical protein
MYNDELTAPQWVLNSAVECPLHTCSRSNTFNNVTGIPGTAEYLIIRVAGNVYRCRCGCQQGLPERWMLALD